MDRQAGCAGDGSDGFDKGLNRRGCGLLEMAPMGLTEV